MNRRIGRIRRRRSPRNPNAYLRRAIHNLRVDDQRHDQTLQRSFERAFESRDLPDSRAARADGSDNCRSVGRILRRMDRPLVRLFEVSVIRETAASLPKPTQPGELPLAKLLWAIYRNRGDRRRMLAELSASEKTFSRGVKKIFEELPRLMKSGVCGVSCEEWLSLKRAKFRLGI